MPPSPWQPTQSSAFSLPGAISAARADVQKRAATHSAAIKVFLISSSDGIPGCASWRRPGIHNPERWLWIPGSLASLAPWNDGGMKRLRSRWRPQPRSLQSLLAEADAIDRAGPVVGHQHRAVFRQHDVGGTAEIALIALEPAFRKDLLLRVLTVGTDDDALDPRALVFMPVPGAVLGDEDVVLVLGGELIAGIELHAERRDMGAEVQHRRGELRALMPHREFRIRQVALVAIRIAEMLADLVDHVELVARDVVAHPVAGVFGDPVFS